MMPLTIPGGSDVTPGQQQVAQVMAGEAVAWCAATGIRAPYALTGCLFANAWAESGWNPRAKGDGGLSWGLFQCHTTRGLGRTWINAGGDAQALFDPAVNTRLILWEFQRQPQCRAAITRGNLRDLVQSFVYFVERPADKPGATATRWRYAQHFYGTADLSIPCLTFG